MLRNFLYIFVAISVAFSLFLLAEDAFSHAFHNCMSTYTADYGNDSDNKSIKFLAAVTNPTVCSASFIDRHNGLFAALAGVAVAIFTWTLKRSTDRLWLAGEKQRIAAHQAFKIQIVGMKASIATADRAAKAAESSAKVAEKSLVATQRAFVFLKEIAVTFDRPLTPPPESPAGSMVRKLGFSHMPIKTWKLAPVWENSGDTPTRRLMINSASTMLSAGMTDDFIFSYNTEAQRSLIGPKATLIGDGTLLGSDTLETIMKSSGHRFYIWGFAEYDDVFEDTPRHRTEFCVLVDFVGLDSNGLPILRFPFHNRHNNSDEECTQTPTPYVALS